MLPISVCLIAKNEELCIEECLRRLSAYDWEIIVADTGSTDRTVEIARRYTPNVFHFDWVNDFSAARNYSISKAKNDYILVVDCDEYLETDENTGQIIEQLTEMIAPGQVGLFNLSSPTFDTAADELSSDSVCMVHEHIARFFNKNHVCYQGSIHEQLASSDGMPLTFISIPLTFYHAGYSTYDLKKLKTARNLPLLEAELQNNRNDPYILFQLGQSYFGLTDYEQALPYFEKALSMDVNEKEEYVQTLVESYGYCLLYLQQYDKALELEGVYHIFSKRADFVFLMGLIYMNNALFDRAVEEFQKAVSITDHAVEGVNSYKAYYNAGVILECMGKIPQAADCYKKCGSYAPAIERMRMLE